MQKEPHGNQLGELLLWATTYDLIQFAIAKLLNCWAKNLVIYLSYRSTVKYKKKRRLLVLQWFQICIVLTPSDWCILYLLLRICLHLYQYDMMYLSYTQIAFYYIHLECYPIILLKWLYRKHYWPTPKRFLSWYVWSLFCSVGGGSHPLHK